tara:strand:+ start:4008 stop:4169 length:162 start_codon:yes stop_codon:yes gene_type:complete
LARPALRARAALRLLEPTAQEPTGPEQRPEPLAQEPLAPALLAQEPEPEPLAR